jgi:hypothetical protein
MNRKLLVCREKAARSAGPCPLGAAIDSSGSDAVAVPVEAVGVGVGDVPADAEVAERDVGAVEVGWRRLD